MDVTLENAMVMLCHTAETRPKEQPSRYSPRELEKVKFTSWKLS